jgi:hypothetical protein
MRNRLQTVIEYLEGKVDIYDGKHGDVISAWDYIWDEMKWAGYDPESASDIKRYIWERL